MRSTDILKNSVLILSVDNELVREVTSLLKNFPEFTLVGVTGNYSEAHSIILKLSPSIVFLDVDPRGRIGDPFRLVADLHQFIEELPTLIAISSTKKLAFEAIKSQFFDFLLKPLNDLELRKCFLKYQKKLKSESEEICLRSYSDYRFLRLREILYLKADNNTTDFFLSDQTFITAYKTLKYYEKALPPDFVRVHNSYIINTCQVVRINFSKSLISLRGAKIEVPFSKTYKNEVDHLKQNFYTGMALVS